MKNTIAWVLLAVLAGCSGSPSTQSPAIAVTSGATIPTSGFGADLNGFRASQGLGPMRPNATLSRAAQAHAEDMARRGYFSHDSPGGPNGNDFVARAKSAGCAMRSGAENIAAGQKTEPQVLTAWQNSAGHRRNMLVPSYTQYGLGRSGDIWVLKLAAGC